MRIRDLKLRSKVILHVLVLGLITATVLIVLFITTQRSVIYAFSQQKAELVGSLIKSSVFMMKKCGRIEDAQDKIVELRSTSHSIRRIRILTLDGRVFASTELAENGLVLPAAELATVKDMVARQSPSQSIFSKPDSSVRSLMLVENKPECLDCHSAGAKFNGLVEVNFDYREAAVLLRTSQWKGVILALTGLSLLTFIILRLFERLINRPISLLKKEMKKIQEGDLNVHLSRSKDDEIGSLTASFNAMVENLRTANKKIKDLYNERIDKAEHLAAFGELAAGLAHEVKNPLSGMKGALEIISQGAPSQDSHKEIYQEILVQIDKIINVIQDFLSYARPKPLRFRLEHPNRFVENAMRLAKTQVDGKEVLFEFQGLPASVRVCLDADRMQEVMLNLMLNSIAAIEKRGRIRIGLTASPEKTLDIALADDGSGIKLGQISQIFNPFFSTKKGGTGLGLSICKKTIDAHRGAISVESREGQGTTFLIRLPLSQPCD
jgi:signal transduction histidine kinase